MDGEWRKLHEKKIYSSNEIYIQYLIQDKQSKHGLRKHSKYFNHDRGQHYYVGGKSK